MGDKNKDYDFTKEELMKFVDGVIDRYESKSSKEYEIINYKLDSIEAQTTRTNGRLTDLENRVKDIEIEKGGRISTCPYSETIKKLSEDSITVNAIKRMLIQGIVIAGLFFTILFGILRLIMNESITLW